MHRDFVYNMPMSAPLLAIKAAGNAAAKTTNAVKYKINGRIYSTAAIATLTIPATFVIDTGFQQGLTVYINAAGTVSYEEGKIVANSVVYNFADFAMDDKDLCILGYILVKNAAVGQFIGATTLLDAASVTVTYIDNFGVIGC